MKFSSITIALALACLAACDGPIVDPQPDTSQPSTSATTGTTQVEDPSTSTTGIWTTGEPSTGQTTGTTETPPDPSTSTTGTGTTEAPDDPSTSMTGSGTTAG